MSRITIKKGATFRFNALYKDREGNPVDITGYDITCQVRDITGNLIAQVSINKLDQAIDTGVFTLQTDTENFPLGNLFFDIRIENLGVVVYTSTVTMTVLNRVTNE